jgi:hypothetical protein
MIEGVNSSYDIFDILWDLSEMPQCTPSTTIKKKQKTKKITSIISDSLGADRM